MIQFANTFPERSLKMSKLFVHENFESKLNRREGIASFALNHESSFGLFCFKIQKTNEMSMCAAYNSGFAKCGYFSYFESSILFGPFV